MFPTAMLVRCLTRWWLQAVPFYTPDRNGVLHQEPKNLIFIALYYSNNFNSTAPFKNAILVPDLAGRLFGGDVEELIPCKLDRPYVPDSYVS